MIALLVASIASQAHSQVLGFDRNDYPGDENLKALHQTFAFAGYWLNNPPGERTNTWKGKRKTIEEAGFGFLVLFNGRLYAELKSVSHARALGGSDAKLATAAAHRDSFPAGTIIFLDQEQGGRMLPEQKAYIYAWVDAVNQAGFRAGVYCSGIAFQESPQVSIVTANDIRESAGARNIVYFVTNDACPPSPGCVTQNPPKAAANGLDFADIWQFAQSPKRKDVAGRCPANYNPDGNCYPLGLEGKSLHVDLDAAASPDPSHGRTQ